MIRPDSGSFGTCLVWSLLYSYGWSRCHGPLFGLGHSGCDSGTNRYADWYTGNSGSGPCTGRLMDPIRRPLPSSYSYLASIFEDVWLRNAQDLIKQGIADLSPLSAVRTTSWFTHAQGLDPRMAFTIMERVRKGLWLKISEEERNGYIAAMKKLCARSGTSRSL